MLFRRRSVGDSSRLPLQASIDVRGSARLRLRPLLIISCLSKPSAGSSVAASIVLCGGMGVGINCCLVRELLYQTIRSALWASRDANCRIEFTNGRRKGIHAAAMMKSASTLIKSVHGQPWQDYILRRSDSQINCSICLRMLISLSTHIFRLAR